MRKLSPAHPHAPQPIQVANCLQSSMPARAFEKNLRSAVPEFRERYANTGAECLVDTPAHVSCGWSLYGSTLCARCMHLQTVGTVANDPGYFLGANVQRFDARAAVGGKAIQYPFMP
jgi:hypothetical protein